MNFSALISSSSRCVSRGRVAKPHAVVATRRAMSGWRTNIGKLGRDRIDIIFAEDSMTLGHWLGFRVNGGPLRYAGLLIGGCRVRPWVYMSSWEKREQLTSSPYLVVDTTDAEMRRDASRAWTFAYAEDESDDESEGEPEGESEGESEGGLEDENGN